MVWRSWSVAFVLLLAVASVALPGCTALVVFGEIASAEESYREEDEGSAGDEVGEVRENDDGDDSGGHGYKLGLICSIVVVFFVACVVVAMIVGFCCCCKRCVGKFCPSMSPCLDKLSCPCLHPNPDVPHSGSVAQGTVYKH